MLGLKIELEIEQEIYAEKSQDRIWDLDNQQERDYVYFSTKKDFIVL